MADPAIEQQFQSDLLAGEKILWAGQPNRSLLFSKEDFLLVPFGLFWIVAAVYLLYVQPWELPGFSSNPTTPVVFFAIFIILAF